MMRTAFVLLLVVAFTSFAAAQAKPWTEWSQKDAEKVLNDSAWGQSYTEEIGRQADTTVVTNTRGGMSGDRKGESGDNNNVPKPLRYRARLLSAKPVREAFARMILLQQKEPSPEFAGQLQGFVDRNFGDFLVVSFDVESSDPRRMQGMQAMLTKLTADAVKERVFLERADGKRAAFIDYKPPIGDGMGGKFVFSKTLDNEPFLNDGVESVKFVMQFSEKQKIAMTFRVSKMSYNGKLEY